MRSIIRDERGRFIPVVQPKLWLADSVQRSRDRTDHIMRSRKQRKATRASTEWGGDVGRRGVCQLEATGIEWRCIVQWRDELDPGGAFAARMFVKQVWQALGDDEASRAERSEVRRELYRRLIAAGIID